MCNGQDVAVRDFAVLRPMLDSVKESVYWELVHAVHRLLCETDRTAGIAKDVQLQLAHHRVHISFRRRVDGVPSNTRPLQ